MKRKRQLFYGWLDAATGAIFISRYPADAPVRPAARFDDLDQVRAFLDRKRADVYWWPPLPDAMNAESEKSLRVEGWRSRNDVAVSA